MFTFSMVLIVVLLFINNSDARDVISPQASAPPERDLVNRPLPATVNLFIESISQAAALSLLTCGWIGNQMTRLKHFLCLLRPDSGMNTSAETEELLLRLILFILGLYLLPLILSSSSSMLTCPSLRDCLPPVVAHLSDIIEGSSPPGSLRGPRSGSTSSSLSLIRSARPGAEPAELPYKNFFPSDKCWRESGCCSLMLDTDSVTLYTSTCDQPFGHVTVEKHIFFFLWFLKQPFFFLMSSPTFNKAAKPESITAAHCTDVVVRVGPLSSFLLLIICYGTEALITCSLWFYLHKQTLLNICTEQQAAFKCKWEVCYCCWWQN